MTHPAYSFLFKNTGPPTTFTLKATTCTLFTSQSFNQAGETENIYNVTPDPSKASIFIISQVGEHRIQVTVTLTSKAMRDEEHVAEETGGEGEKAAAPVNQVTTSEYESVERGVDDSMSVTVCY